MPLFVWRIPRPQVKIRWWFGIRPVYVFPKSNSGVLRVDPENRVLSPKASFFEIEFHVGHLGTRILDVRSQFNDSYF